MAENDPIPELADVPDAGPEETREPQVLEVSLVLAEKKVVIRDKAGDARPYTVREMHGTLRDFFLDENAKRARTDARGNPTGLRDFKGVQSILISKCLFDENNKPVPRQVIDQWPSTAQMKLFEVCEQINGFADRTGEAAKKD